MTFCAVHNCTMKTDSTCKARLKEIARYESKGIKGGISLGPEKMRYEDLLKCRECKGGDATPQKFPQRGGRNGGRPVTVKKEKKPRPVGLHYQSKWDGKSCAGGNDHGPIYARKMCKVCYNRAYRQGKF